MSSDRSSLSYFEKHFPMYTLTPLPFKLILQIGVVAQWLEQVILKLPQEVNQNLLLTLLMSGSRVRIPPAPQLE